MAIRKTKRIDKAIDPRVEELIQSKVIRWKTSQASVLRRNSYYNVQLLYDFIEYRKNHSYSLNLAGVVELLRFTARESNRPANVYEWSYYMMEKFMDRLRHVQKETNKHDNYVIYATHAVSKFIDFAFARDKDLVVKGVKVYDKINTAYFFKCKGAITPDKKKFFNKKMYDKVMEHLEENRLYLYRAVFSLMYNTGMHIEDIAELKESLLHQMPNSKGYFQSQTFSRGSRGRYYYIIHEDDLQYIDDWFSMRLQYSERIFDIGDDKMTSPINQHWMDIFWTSEVLPIIDKDMSFRCLAHDYFQRKLTDEFEA